MQKCGTKRGTFINRKKIPHILTEITIRNLKEKHSIYRVSDRDGLMIVVRSSGGKNWILRYQKNDKRVDKTLGKYLT